MPEVYRKECITYAGDFCGFSVYANDYMPKDKLFIQLDELLYRDIFKGCPGDPKYWQRAEKTYSESVNKGQDTWSLVMEAIQVKAKERMIEWMLSPEVVARAHVWVPRKVIAQAIRDLADQELQMRLAVRKTPRLASKSGTSERSVISYQDTSGAQSPSNGILLRLLLNPNSLTNDLSNLQSRISPYLRFSQTRAHQ
jgi:hypothetical protein